MQSLSSDNILKDFQDSIKLIPPFQLKKTKLIYIQKWVKPLDRPLNWREKIANVFRPINHTFIVVVADGFFLSADYHDLNNGTCEIRAYNDMDGILNCEPGKRRKQSKICSTAVKAEQWRFQIKHLVVEDFFLSVIKANPQEDFHSIGNNCHDFSNKLWEIMIAKQKREAKIAILAQ